MADQTLSEWAEIATLLREQLKFFQDIGITDIGGSQKAASHRIAEGAGVVAKIADQPGRVEAVAPEPLESGSRDGGPDIASMEASHGGAFGADAAQASAKPDQTTARTGSPVKANGPDQPLKQDEVPQLDLFGQPVAQPPRQAARATAPVTNMFDRLPRDFSLEEIRSDIGDCTRCKLAPHRTHIVFGEGDPKADLVFVGEGPGADEDASGRPFVGRAGKLLDKIIEAIGLKREEVYICNVVKCRPPGNRTPEPDEVAACEGFLFRQLGVIRPKVVVALGAPAFQCLVGSRESITRARGQWRDWNGCRLMATYHPAYLLRLPNKKRETWEDVKKIRDYLATFSKS